MPPKTRTQAGRGSRGILKRGRFSQQGSRNITRWSANKDIALLCALAKECRKDKFRISWHRVAKWIGPNVTGGAIEQHVQKLYTKLKEHRSSREPRRKKKKQASQSEDDDNDGDYVEDEEIWDKGNEAFANIFYDKPEAGSIMEDDNGSLSESVDYAENLQQQLYPNQYLQDDQENFHEAQVSPYPSMSYPAQGQYYHVSSDAQHGFSNRLLLYDNQVGNNQSSLVQAGYKFDNPSDDLPENDHGVNPRYQGNNSTYQYDGNRSDSPAIVGSPNNVSHRDVHPYSPAVHRQSTQYQFDPSSLRASQIGFNRQSARVFQPKEEDTLASMEDHNRTGYLYASDQNRRNSTYASSNGKCLPDAESSRGQIDHRGHVIPEGQFTSTRPDAKYFQMTRDQGDYAGGPDIQHGRSSSPSNKHSPNVNYSTDQTRSKDDRIKVNIKHTSPSRSSLAFNSPLKLTHSTSILPSIETTNIKKEPVEFQDFGGVKHEESLFFNQFASDDFVDS